MRKISRTFGLLVVNIATAILATTVALASLWPAQHHPAARAKSLATKHATPNLPRATPAADLLTYPLFTQSRVASAVSSTPAQALPEMPINPPVLLGVVGENGKLSALLEDTMSNTRKLLRKGDAFGNWTLVALDRKRVTLQMSDQQLALTLDAAQTPSNETQNKQQGALQ